MTDLGGDLLVTVRPGSEKAADRLLRSYGLTATASRADGAVRLTVRGYGSAERKPVTGDLVRALEGLGSAVRAVRLP